MCYTKTSSVELKIKGGTPAPPPPKKKERKKEGRKEGRKEQAGCGSVGVWET